MAVTVRIVLMTAAVAVIAGAGSARASTPPFEPGPVDHAFDRLYNFDFAGSLSILEAAARTDPRNPLVPSVRAAAYLFMELDRMKILETKFFMNDDNMVDGSSRRTPDPQVRERFYAALQSARTLADARLAVDPDDLEGLLALCMSASLETDYVALVERRTWRSIRLAPRSLGPAGRLLARTPPFYDAYVHFGALEYIVGDLPFFLRWFVRYDGIDGDKQRGIEQLKLAAAHGRYYGPFARILLVVAALREEREGEAERLLAGLVQDYPENPVFRKELAIVAARARRDRRERSGRRAHRAAARRRAATLSGRIAA